LRGEGREGVASLNRMAKAATLPLTPSPQGKGSFRGRYFVNYSCDATLGGTFFFTLPLLERLGKINDAN